MEEPVPPPEQDEDTAQSSEDAQAADAPAEQTISVEDVLWLEGARPEAGDSPEAASLEEGQLRAVLEAIIYVAEEPVTPAQIAAALRQPIETVRLALARLAEELDKPEHGIDIREVAGGYKMATKPEHHETVRSFVKSLKPPLKLSLPALETLAVVAYKQPVTSPEIMEIRGVQGAGVLKTLLDRKLIAAAGRKNVIGKPILYKTTREFLIQFGLSDLTELPSLKEFEEIRRIAIPEGDEPAPTPEGESATAAPEPRLELVPEPQADPEAPAEAQPDAASEPASEPAAPSEPPSEAPNPEPAPDPGPLAPDPGPLAPDPGPPAPSPSSEPPKEES
jgi:segregation and condensation protein B